MEGWPSKCSDLPTILKPYWTIKDYISIDDGILLKGQQIIIPDSLKTDILSQLHNFSHQGIEKTRSLARKCVYWPNINDDIAKEVGECTVCNTFMNSLPPEPMYEREIPTVPWEMLRSDIFDYKRQKYLLVCDYFSKFPIIRKLESETSSCIIKYLSQIFSEQGIPKILFIDNGPCSEFQKFSEKYGFRHTTSSPHFPQSNGLAEWLVGTCIVKSTLKKCDMSKTDTELAMLFPRTTPISHTLASPAESVLPSVKHQLEHETTREKLKH